jgi:phage-related baseplate assembly protein
MPTKALPVIDPPGGNGAVIITSGPSTDPSAPAYGLQWVPGIDFAVKDPAVISNEVILDYQAAFLALTGIAKTLAPGDPVRLHLLVVCYWLSQQRVIIDYTGKQNLLKYSTGDYLDNLAALYGQRTMRLPESAALTTLAFTLAAPLAFNAVIEKGTLCQAPNSIVFETLADGVINAGDETCEVPAQATIKGAVGNGFAPGQIAGVINWNQPYALTVSNTIVTAGGSDEETDEQYRYRVWLAIESFSTCGPHDAYEFWALSAHPDIIQAVVYSAPDIAGEVWIFPLLKGGELPTQPILDLVYAKCSKNTRRPLTDWVKVFSPTVFTYVLNMNYWVERNNEVLLETIRGNVEQAARDWILWEKSYVSRDLNCDELRKRCLEAGAKRIVVNTPTPTFQVMNYNQLAVHNPAVEPIVNFVGLEEA